MTGVFGPGGGYRKTENSPRDQEGQNRGKLEGENNFAEKNGCYWRRERKRTKEFKHKAEKPK